MVGRGGTAEEGEEPWKCVGGRRAKGAAWGERSEDEEVHLEGNEEGTSSLEEEGPTLEKEEKESEHKVRGHLEIIQYSKVVMIAGTAY